MPVCLLRFWLDRRNRRGSRCRVGRSSCSHNTEEQMSEELAVPRPVIPPSDAEREACERLATISTDGCEEKAKAAKLKATLTFDKPEPTPVPTFLERANATEQSRIRAEIDRLRKSDSTV